MSEAAKRSKRKASAPLPFVKKPKGGLTDYWAPVSTGDNGEDYTLGEQYAEAALDHALQPGGEILLHSIVVSMLHSFGFNHDDKHLEFGFLFKLVWYAMKGAQVQQRLKQMRPGQTLKFSYTKPREAAA
jgi:hypothetical protein